MFKILEVSMPMYTVSSPLAPVAALFSFLSISRSSSGASLLYNVVLDHYLEMVYPNNPISPVRSSLRVGWMDVEYQGIFGKMESDAQFALLMTEMPDSVILILAPFSTEKRQYIRIGIGLLRGNHNWFDDATRGTITLL
jgi:hypothetical protein